MNMVEAVRSVLSQYVGFSGRARRSEFWFWKLATVLMSIGIMIVEGALGLGFEGSGPISLIFSLAIFIPDLAVSFRRLHDTGRSGWWIGGFYLGIILFVFVVGISFAAVLGTGADSTASSALGGVLALVFGLGIIVYLIAMLVFLCTDSDVGPNKYGPNPKHEGNYDVFE